MAGKGDRDRTKDRKRFESNWDHTFKKPLKKACGECPNCRKAKNILEAKRTAIRLMDGDLVETFSLQLEKVPCTE